MEDNARSMDGPKILLVDIETAPILAYCWAIWEQDIALNQIKSDWHLLSWSAKWLGSKEIFYKDQRNAKNIEDDKELLKGIWELLDEADIVVSQNGKQFDIKRLNARFVINGFNPPSSFKHVDTKQIAKSKFGFTSNKLEYMSEKLNIKYKKMKNSGFSLWTRCLAGELAAWKEMEKYNKYDVLALEELYLKLRPWDNSINVNLYTESLDIVCVCGSKDFKKNGYSYTSLGKFQRYVCKKKDCGTETRSRKNLLSKEKRETLRAKT